MALPAGVRGVLVDIEGTTTAISFVYETLFPYAAARLEATCAGRAAEPRVAAAIALLRAEHAAEPLPSAGAGGGAGAGRSGGAAGGHADRQPFGDGAAYARRLMDADSKSTALKELQGLIWEEGYAAGELRGHVFPDVPPALAAWRAAGVRLRVFSSGSRRAQRLLFAHTEHGDLTAHFEGCHDTTTGTKLAAPAYRDIAAAFALPAAELLYLSDVAGELDAAAAAGYRTGLLLRPGNRPQTAGAHPTHHSFAELATP
jgi:enolase-phosphatase E1